MSFSDTKLGASVSTSTTSDGPENSSKRFKAMSEDMDTGTDDMGSSRVNVPSPPDDAISTSQVPLRQHATIYKVSKPISNQSNTLSAKHAKRKGVLSNTSRNFSENFNLPRLQKSFSSSDICSSHPQDASSSSEELAWSDSDVESLSRDSYHKKMSKSLSRVSTQSNSFHNKEMWSPTARNLQEKFRMGAGVVTGNFSETSTTARSVIEKDFGATTGYCHYVSSESDLESELNGLLMERKLLKCSSISLCESNSELLVKQDESGVTPISLRPNVNHTTDMIEGSDNASDTSIAARLALEEIFGPDVILAESSSENLYPEEILDPIYQPFHLDQCFTQPVDLENRPSSSGFQGNHFIHYPHISSVHSSGTNIDALPANDNGHLPVHHNNPTRFTMEKNIGQQNALFQPYSKQSQGHHVSKDIVAECVGKRPTANNGIVKPIDSISCGSPKEILSEQQVQTTQIVLCQNQRASLEMENNLENDAPKGNGNSVYFEESGVELQVLPEGNNNISIVFPESISQQDDDAPCSNATENMIIAGSKSASNETEVGLLILDTSKTGESSPPQTDFSKRENITNDQRQCMTLTPIPGSRYKEKSGDEKDTHKTEIQKDSAIELSGILSAGTERLYSSLPGIDGNITSGRQVSLSKMIESAEGFTCVQENDSENYHLCFPSVSGTEDDKRQISQVQENMPSEKEEKQISMEPIDYLSKQTASLRTNLPKKMSSKRTNNTILNPIKSLKETHVHFNENVMVEAINSGVSKIYLEPLEDEPDSNEESFPQSQMLNEIKPVPGTSDFTDPTQSVDQGSVCQSEHSVSDWLESFLVKTTPYSEEVPDNISDSEGVRKEFDVKDLSLVSQNLQKLLDYKRVFPVHERLNTDCTPSLCDISGMLDHLLLHEKSKSEHLGESSLEDICCKFHELVRSVSASEPVESQTKAENPLKLTLDSFNMFHLYINRQREAPEDSGILRHVPYQGEREITLDIPSVDNQDVSNLLQFEMLTEKQIDAGFENDNKESVASEMHESFPSLNDVRDILLKALSLRMEIPAKVLLKQYSSKSLESSKGMTLVTISSVLNNLLNIESIARPGSSSSVDIKGVVNLQDEIVTEYESCLPNTFNSIKILFVEFLNNQENAQVRRDIYEGVAHAFRMFEDYLATIHPVDYYTSNDDSEYDRHDVEVFSNPDPYQLTEKTVSLNAPEIQETLREKLETYSTKTVSDIKKGILEESQVQKPNVVPAKLSKAGVSKTHSSSSKKSLDKDTEDDQMCHSVSEKVLGKDTSYGKEVQQVVKTEWPSSMSDLTVSIKKDSSQSLPCKSSTKVQLNEISNSAECLRPACKSNPMAPLSTTNDSSLSRPSDLSTKDSLPGYESPSEMLKEKQVQLISNVVQNLPSEESSLGTLLGNEEMASSPEGKVVPLTKKTPGAKQSQKLVSGENIPEVKSSNNQSVSTYEYANHLSEVDVLALDAKIPKSSLSSDFSDTDSMVSISTSDAASDVVFVVLQTLTEDIEESNLGKELSSTTELNSFVTKQALTGHASDSKEFPNASVMESVSQQNTYIHNRDNSNVTVDSAPMAFTNIINLSFVGHFATSEILNRDMSIPTDTGSGISALDDLRRENITQGVQSDQTEYFLSSKFRLLPESNIYSHSDPRANAGVPSNSSSDFQWNFRDGDGENSSIGDEADIGGWFDLAGNRGDNDLPEMDIFEEHNRNVFNEHTDLDSLSEASSHSGEIADGLNEPVVASDTSVWTTEDSLQELNPPSIVAEMHRHIGNYLSQASSDIAPHSSDRGHEELASLPNVLDERNRADSTLDFMGESVSSVRVETDERTGLQHHQDPVALQDKTSFLSSDSYIPESLDSLNELLDSQSRLNALSSSLIFSEDSIPVYSEDSTLTNVSDLAQNQFASTSQAADSESLQNLGNYDRPHTSLGDKGQLLKLPEDDVPSTSDPGYRQGTLYHHMNPAFDYQNFQLAKRIPFAQTSEMDDVADSVNILFPPQQPSIQSSLDSRKQSSFHMTPNPLYQRSSPESASDDLPSLHNTGKPHPMTGPNDTAQFNLPSDDRHVQCSDISHVLTSEDVCLTHPAAQIVTDVLKKSLKEIQNHLSFSDVEQTRLANNVTGLYDTAPYAQPYLPSDDKHAVYSDKSDISDFHASKNSLIHPAAQIVTDVLQSSLKEIQNQISFSDVKQTRLASTDKMFHMKSNGICQKSCDDGHTLREKTKPHRDGESDSSTDDNYMPFANKLSSDINSTLSEVNVSHLAAEIVRDVLQRSLREIQNHMVSYTPLQQQQEPVANTSDKNTSDKNTSFKKESENIPQQPKPGLTTPSDKENLQKNDVWLQYVMEPTTTTVFQGLKVIHEGQKLLKDTTDAKDKLCLLEIHKNCPFSKQLYETSPNVKTIPELPNEKVGCQSRNQHVPQKHGKISRKSLQTTQSIDNRFPSASLDQLHSHGESLQHNSLVKSKKKSLLETLSDQEFNQSTQKSILGNSQIQCGIKDLTLSECSLERSVEKSSVICLDFDKTDTNQEDLSIESQNPNVLITKEITSCDNPSMFSKTECKNNTSGEEAGKFSGFKSSASIQRNSDPAGNVQDSGSQVDPLDNGHTSGGEDSSQPNKPNSSFLNRASVVMGSFWADFGHGVYICEKDAELDGFWENLSALTSHTAWINFYNDDVEGSLYSISKKLHITVNPAIGQEQHDSYSEHHQRAPTHHPNAANTAGHPATEISKAIEPRSDSPTTQLRPHPLVNKKSLNVAEDLNTSPVHSYPLLSASRSPERFVNPRVDDKASISTKTQSTPDALYLQNQLDLTCRPPQTTATSEGPSKNREHSGEKAKETAEGALSSDVQGISGGFCIPEPLEYMDESGKIDPSLKKRTFPVLSSNYRIASQDVRTYLIEKELLESQCRRLQVEVTTLQSENKQLIEKNNLVTAKCSELQLELVSVTKQLDVTKARIGQEISEANRKNKITMETKMEALQRDIIKLNKENEKVNLELMATKAKLEKSPSALTSAGELIQEDLKVENTMLKAQLAELKTLLSESEAQLKVTLEEQRNSEAGFQNRKVKDGLYHNHELEQSAADKIIKSLEKRLQITEERFFSERSDRGNMLSEVEENLLSENSKLTIAEKELTRQLQRLQDRCKHLDLKVKDMREENMSLRLALPLGTDIPTSTRNGSYDLPHSIHSTIRTESKLMTKDVKEIMALVQHETGYDNDREIDMMCELWRRYESATRKLLEWEQELFQLKISQGDITIGLQNLREMKSQYEEKIRQAEEEVEDILNEKNTMESTYKQQLSELVSERHAAISKLQTVEDLMAGLKAENQVLRQKIENGDESFNEIINKHKEQLEELKVEKDQLTVKNSQLERQLKVSQGEIEGQRTELKVREKSLTDMQNNLEILNQSLSQDESESERQIKTLQSQIIDLQSDVELWQEKYNNLCEEKINMEEQVEAANQQAVMSKVKSMEEEEISKVNLQQNLLQKEAEIKSLTRQYQEVEKELETTKQNLLLEVQHRTEVERQLETLERQLEERHSSLERQAETSREQSKQHDSLKGALDSVVQELRKSQASVKKLELDLSREKDKSAHLQSTIDKLTSPTVSEEVITQDKIVASSSPVSRSSPGILELKVKDLESERDRLKEELAESLQTVECQRGEITEVHNRMRAVGQQLGTERDTVCQMAADKSDLEQHLQACLEERDEIFKEKDASDRDLNKVEERLHDIVTQFDLDSRGKLSNFQDTYPNLGPEAQKLLEECLTLRALLHGKDTEIGVLTDKLSRQDQEMEFSRHRIEFLMTENHSNREDISRLTREVAQKLQELSSVGEVNQLLVDERARLQLELHQAHVELEREKSYTERRNSDVTDILKKFEESSTSQRQTQEDLHKLDNKSAILETDLRHANQTIALLETDRQQSKAKQDRLNEDIRSLTNANSALEKYLQQEKQLVTDRTVTMNRLEGELKEKTQQLELIKHEKAMLMTSLDSERKTVDNLQTQLKSKEMEISTLKEEIKELGRDLEAHKGRLLVSQENYQQVCKEKQTVYTDYQELCKQLNEKEKIMTDNQVMFNTSLENIQKDFSMEKANLETDRSTTAMEMEDLRDEVRNLKEKISQKEVQLCTFGRTLQELEEMTKQNQVLEEKLEKVNNTAEDTKILINSHRTEIMTLRETNKNLEEQNTKMENKYRSLEDEYRNIRESHSEHTFELKQSMAELKTSREMEKFELKEKLSKTESQLETTQSNLKTLQDLYKEMQENNQSLESALHEIKSQLNQVKTEKQILAEKLTALEARFVNTQKISEDACGQLRETRTKFSKTEQNLEVELQKNQKLHKEKSELEAAAFVHESSIKAKQEQLDILQAEVNRLRQMLETQRQQLASKYKKTAFELKQQMNNQEMERNRLTCQSEQLMTDLEKAREQISAKAKENLKLQEDILHLEGQQRELSSKLRQTQESLKLEEEQQSKLNDRNMQQEEELKKLRIFVSHKAEQDGTGEGKMSWTDLNRFMQELNNKMDTLKSHKSGNNDGPDNRNFQRLRKQLTELETQLHTEKALHQITKNSLQASEDDCQRLRRQLRSKQRTSPNDDRSEKSRMEKINEIIAKSQSQAQMLLATGGYYDYNSRDVSLISPRSVNHSPDTSLFDHHPHFNLSHNNNTSLSLPSSPEKTPLTSTPPAKTLSFSTPEKTSLTSASPAKVL